MSATKGLGVVRKNTGPKTATGPAGASTLTTPAMKNFHPLTTPASKPKAATRPSTHPVQRR